MITEEIATSAGIKVETYMVDQIYLGQSDGAKMPVSILFTNYCFLTS